MQYRGGMDAHSHDLHKKMVGAAPSEWVSPSVKRYAATVRAGRTLASKKRPDSKPKTGEAARKFSKVSPTQSTVGVAPLGVAGPCGGCARQGGRPASRECRGGWVGTGERIGGCGRARPEFPRTAWLVLVAGSLGADRPVFVEEAEIAPLTSPYAWCPKSSGRCSAPKNQCRNTTLLTSTPREDLGPRLAVEGPTTGALSSRFT